MKKFFRVTCLKAETGTCCCGPEHIAPEGTQRIIVAENSEEAEMQFLATIVNEEAKKNDPTEVDSEGENEVVDYVCFSPTKIEGEEHTWYDEDALGGQGIIYEFKVEELF